MDILSDVSGGGLVMVGNPGVDAPGSFHLVIVWGLREDGVLKTRRGKPKQRSNILVPNNQVVLEPTLRSVLFSYSKAGRPLTSNSLSAAVVTDGT